MKSFSLSFHFNILQWREVCHESLMERSSWYVIIIMCAKFLHFILKISASRSLPSSMVDLIGCWWFLTGDLEDGIIIDVIENLDLCLSTCVQNFRFIASTGVHQEPHILHAALGGYWINYWWFLDLEDEVILDFIDHLDMLFSTCVPNFNILTWRGKHQEPPVFDGGLGGQE